jgi:expansin (peptidoglycan-binding protein)
VLLSLMMPMHSWWHRTRLLFAALPFLPLACVSGTEPPSGEGSGAVSGVAGSGSGSAGKPNGGSAGAKGGATSVGGSSGVASSGGTSSGSAGLPGAGGTVSPGAGGTSAGVGGSGTPVTGGSGGVGGSLTGAGGSVASGGSGAMSGAGGTNATGGSGATGGSNAAGGSGATGGTSTDPCAGVTCGTGQTCSGGTCMCTTGTLCSNSCVDTTQDASNCGACGTKCDSGGACIDGKCVNPMCNPDTTVRNGHVTHYSLATSMVACHYPTNTLPQYYGAMNEYDWNTAAVCGACVEITNGGNKLVVQIVDECPYKGNEMWCYSGSHHIDLNPDASNTLNANSNPAVTWKFVSCTPTGNIKYYFDSASQQYYLAVTPMNFKNPMAKMEVKVGASYQALTRNTSDMFELTMGAGTGSLTFRLTDIYNHVVTDTVMMSPGQVVTGSAQFAACP